MDALFKMLNKKIICFFLELPFCLWFVTSVAHNDTGGKIASLQTQMMKLAALETNAKPIIWLVCSFLCHFR